MNDRHPPARRLSRLAARALAVGLVVLVVSTAGMSAALAVGNATLQGYILTDPIPGWGPAPTSEVQNLQSQVSTSLSSETHKQIAVAVEGWSGPNANADVLLITLARFTSSTVPPATNLQNSANEVCTGAGEKPGTISSISGIPDSFSEVCQGGTAPVLAADWEEGDIVAFVDASGMSQSTLESVSRAQSAKIPGGGSGGGSSSSSSSLYAGIGVAAVVIGVGIVFMRRRSAARATPAPAGDFFSPNTGPPQWGPGTPPPGAPAPGQGYGAPPAGQGYGAAQPYPAPGEYTPPAGRSAPPGQYAPPAGQYTPPEQWDQGQQAQPYGTPAPAAQQPPVAGYPAGAGSATGAQPPSSAMPGGSSDETVTVGGWQPQAVPPSERPAPAAEPPIAQASPVAQPEPVAPTPPAPAPVAEPPREVGWHPIEGDVNRQRYWDGSSWTARMRWDGTSWVNESSP